jgi:serpin B
MDSPITQFAITLYPKLSRNETFTISPLSLWLALSMTAVGAGSGTLAEMTDMLWFRAASKNGNWGEIFEFAEGRIQQYSSDIEIANAIALGRKVELDPEYQSVIRKYFGGEVFNGVDATTVNKWVSQKTNGKISNLINDDRDTELIILNAVYMKATWKTRFDSFDTRISLFYGLQRQRCHMMHQKASFPFVESYDYQAISLPYDSK